MIVLVKPGLLTTVQDAGRWGRQHEGVPVAGPMDPWSHARANRLVGNAPGAATLEMTLVGPRMRTETPLIAAICGGRFSVTIDGNEAGIERVLEIPAGAEVEIGRCREGARAYLAVRGGIDVPAVLGSRATHLPSAMGGVAGRALVAGDMLRVGTMTTGEPMKTLSSTTAPVQRTPTGDAMVRVLAGPDADNELASCFEALVTARFEVAPESNRMGYRLRGAVLDAPAANRLSTATPMGTVQVPEGGAPILLMADRQTTGGYPRVATVISADLGIAGQLKPGDWLRFTPSSHADALSALRARIAEIDA
jgi:antagonist of KipI